MSHGSILAFLVLVIFATACTPSLNYLNVRSSFTHDALKAAPVGFMPLTTIKAFEDGDLAEMENALASEFHNELETLPLMASGEVRTLLDAAVLDNLLGQFKTSKAIKPAELDGLAPLRERGLRFVAFTRVENHFVTQNQRDYTETRGSGKDQKKVDMVETSSTARMSASMVVYDLNDKTMAWEGNHEVGLTETRTVEREKNSALVDVVKSVTKTQQQFTYPDPPRPGKVFTAILEAFYKNFPQED